MTNLARIRGFLLDMDGTFYLGEKLLPGAVRFLQVLEIQGKDFLFLTNNSSRNRQSYVEKFLRLGVAVPEDKILTSGEATIRRLVTSRTERRIFLVGTPDLEVEFSSAGFSLEEKEPEMVVLGFDTTLTYEKLWKLCDLVRSGLPYIATHPDLNCPTESGVMPDIGAIIAFVQASTGRNPDEVIGKPNRWIVEAAAQKLNMPLEKLAMVGDRLYTDIALGKSSGILTVLVLSGETSLNQVNDSVFKPDYVFDDIEAVAEWLSKEGK